MVETEAVDFDAEMEVEEDGVDVGLEVGVCEEHSSTVLVTVNTIGDSITTSLTSLDLLRGRWWFRPAKGSADVVLPRFLSEVDLWGGWGTVDEEATPKTNSGGMFSPKVRVSFAIFLRLSLSVKSPFLLVLPVLVNVGFGHVDADVGGEAKGEATGRGLGLERMR